MRTRIVFVTICSVGLSALALPDYEPFADATAAGGTSYATGANLAGQIPAYYAAYTTGAAWWELGPDGATGGGIQPTIAAGDLSIPGLFSAGGGHSAAFNFGNSGNSARLNLTTSTAGIQSGTVYFSFALKLTDISRLDTTGTYFAGFNTVQSQNAGTTTPATLAGRVLARSSAGGFNLGIQQGTGGTGNTAVWSTTDYTTSDTLFLVGSYTFNTSTTTDDIARLWINPDSSTFGAASAPGGDLSATGGTDLVRAASFMLLDHAANEPGGLLDDLRLGLSWADVTPVPEPSALALSILGLAVVCVRRFGHR